ncbi:histidine-containing phosphotransfer protein 2-like [Cornus florida]|uniref:histidine-containing phosphotransfer protein 2-like n=1 Tax=Cornus florida TaxID=4283 RepID=UPI0028A17E0A|nr:histidine-containing phosphotransfer protein 2-like [Cornus florida]
MQMALVYLKAELNRFVNSLHEEGLLDGQFTQIQALQDASNPNFVAEVISLFCDDAERIIRELDKFLHQPDVDYHKLDAYVHQLKGSSSSIGAQRMKLACVDLRQASDDKNKERCLQALNKIMMEYFQLRREFLTLVQLEKSVFAYETNQQLQESGYAGVST